MVSTVDLVVTLARIVCGRCGGVYAIAERYRDEKVEVGGFWHCPYCETSWGYGKSANDRLKEELARERAQHDQTRAARDDARRQASAQMAQATKARRKLARVDCGVCPECNRSFANLHRHMKTKHAAAG